MPRLGLPAVLTADLRQKLPDGGDDVSSVEVGGQYIYSADYSGGCHNYKRSIGSLLFRAHEEKNRNPGTGLCSHEGIKPFFLLARPVVADCARTKYE